MSDQYLSKDDGPRIEELSDSDTEQYIASSDIFLPPWLDPRFLELPRDDLITNTTTAQQKVQADCMPFLQLDDTQELPLNSHGLPRLDRDAHIKYLHKALGGYPAPYMAMDASRPWFFLWVLQGLTALGEDVAHYRERLIQTLQPLQNTSGGFAGGHGQNSHAATNYGCVLALAMVEGLHMIDRDSMWRFLGRLKQADGGFRVAEMAEEDVRGAYCAMTVIVLLGLPLDLPEEAPARQAGLTSFLDGLGEWIGQCQTYEGGIAGAPNNEAHGAYTFCGLSCLALVDIPSRSISRYLDVDSLTKWMVNVQTTPEGGFAGRTNKLVDACYSHWLGTTWSLLDATLQSSVSPSLWNREADIRYLLTCCQQPGNKGGMRDKPSARPDAYHTSYAIAGLSAATHHCYVTDEESGQFDESGRLTASFCWSAREASRQELDQYMVDNIDVPNAVHPIFVIPFWAVEKTRTRQLSLIPG